MENYFDAIRTRYGNIKRARGFYLYTEKGIRLIDMCLDYGRSCFGRRVGRLNLTIKQNLDKGMLGFFPSFSSLQFQKVCSDIFPNYIPKIFLSAKKAFDIAKTVLSYDNVTFEKILWRPFASGGKDFLLRTRCFLCFPPFATNTTLLLLDKNLENIQKIDSDTISAIELFTITKSFHELIYAKKLYPPAFYENPLLKNLEPYFYLQGIYLYPKKFISNEKYKIFFEHFLDHHILLSPNIIKPSIFPKLEHYSELKNAVKKIPF